MTSFLKGLAAFLKAFLDFLKSLPTFFTKLAWFLKGLWLAILRCFHRPPRGGCCLDLPPSVHIRPDPMIYDQYYLMAQGLAVTWDNPDIQIYDLAGNVVAGEGLSANTDYKVVARIWNNSYGAPAAGLPVHLSYLSFGIGIVSTPVGATTVNLGVKGSPRCPAFAEFEWHTPAIPGHYCLQALLVWPDDANPANNLGQKNTQVGAMHSPATFLVPVHNDATVRRRFEIEADMYQLPVLARCTEGNPRVNATNSAKQGRYAESRARWDATLRTQAYGMFPVSPAWTVKITPGALDLDPNQTSQVAVSIEHTAVAFTGTQPFNIHGFAMPSAGPRALVGGVTLNAQGN
jgi:hypothetical protein